MSHKEKEKFTFFWQNALSNWKKCSFVYDTIEYNCGEQYMMAEKARLFEDKEIEELIMASKEPSEQKSLGRKVKNFDPKIWEENAKRIVYQGNYARFSQNMPQRDLLFSSIGTTLVEASPFDTIWGIGLEKTDPLSQDRKTWRGKNWLGEVLTDVRDDLWREHEYINDLVKTESLYYKFPIPCLWNDGTVKNKILLLGFVWDRKYRKKLFKTKDSTKLIDCSEVTF